MKEFRSLAVLRHPRHAVWAAMRDRTPALAVHLADVAEIVELSRSDSGDGVVELVNVWRSAAKIPGILRPVLSPEMLAWTDTASWDQHRYECHWRIEPRLMSDACECRGVTRFEEAMAGRGTRIVFGGTFSVIPARLPGATAVIGGPTARGIEAFVTSVVPRNFSKLAKAVESSLSD
jgi:hypothetical protein